MNRICREVVDTSDINNHEKSKLLTIMIRATKIMTESEKTELKEDEEDTEQRLIPSIQSWRGVGRNIGADHQGG